jgi:hypothetical protein
LKYPSAQATRKKQIMPRFGLTENDAATETVVKTPLGRRRARDLLPPRLLSGQVELKTEAA